MPIHTLKLLAKELTANDTYIFKFEKPANFMFIPGQYGGFTLINPQTKDAGGITRRFSVLSTPQDPYLAVLTRIQTSAYKQELNALDIGQEIKFAGPTGSFILHEDLNTPAVMIAGGIGISPFFSMLKNIEQLSIPREIILFYGNHSEAVAPLVSELLSLNIANFRLIQTYNAPAVKWNGENGFINSAMIKKYIPQLTSPIYYVCGSPVMVTTLQETLVELAIPNEQIKVEDFPGY